MATKITYTIINSRGDKFGYDTLDDARYASSIFSGQGAAIYRRTVEVDTAEGWVGEMFGPMAVSEPTYDLIERIA